MKTIKNTFHLFVGAVVGVAMSATLAVQAHAETAQTDVVLVREMAQASNDKKLHALELFYDLHVSELIVQNMNERRTGAMFAVQRAKSAKKAQPVIAQLEQKAEQVVAERAVEIKRNQQLRIALGEVSGLDFSDPLVMTPDAPLHQPTASADVPADLAAAQKQAWATLLEAQNAWREERLTLLDAQQRYDETRDVPIGDHLRAMTKAETVYAKAIGTCRLIEAKIAVATGKPLLEVLSAL